MKTCLVIGGGGFLGMYLSLSLFCNGYNVRVLTRSNPSQECKEVLGGAIDSIEWLIGDYAHEATLGAAIKGANYIFHLISTTVPGLSNKDMGYDVSSNVLPSLVLLRQAVENKVTKVIFISSGGTVYGVPKRLPIDESHTTEPICSYGIHKLVIEKYFYLYKYLHSLSCVVLRVSNPYGYGQKLNKNQGAIDTFINKIVNDKPIVVWGDGNIVRDYIYIDDVIQACLKSIDYQGNEIIFNIGTGKGISLNELIDIISSLLGRPIDHQYVESRKFDVPINILDISKAERELRWSPKVDAYYGIKQLLDRLKIPI